MKKDLAQALGISASMVSRLAKQGMPTGSVNEAVCWRKRYLEAGRMKDFRVGGPGMHQPSIHVTAAQDAMRAARALLDAGAAFDVIEPVLREALKAVPEHDRPFVGLDVEVSRVLLRPLLDLARDDGEPDGAGGALSCMVGEDGDDDAIEAGRVLYLLLCGEAWINPSTNQKPHTKGRSNASAVNT